MTTETEAETNILLVRKVATEHEIHERTLLKALRGETIRGAAVAKRASAAVEEYRTRIKAEGEAQ